MKYLSVCSGIEAASVAWHPLGWKPAAFSEIEPFPSAVLAHHYPDTPNLGDMTQYATWPRSLCPDLLVGGTPCQSFSVAGLRKGLDDPRGNLILTFGAIASRYRPRWLVWENVPGVLSSGGGRDFASFLGLITGQRVDPPAEGWANAGVLSGIASAYGVAWRVLDAQFTRVESHPYAVPQRRRRVFVVGHLGDWRRAAAVLLERESLRGDSAPRRQAGKGTAPTISARTRGGGELGTDFDIDGGLIPSADAAPIGFRMQAFGQYEEDGTASAMKQRDAKDATDLIIAFPERMSATQCASAENLSPALGAKNPTAVAFEPRCKPHRTTHINTGQGWWNESDVAGTVRTPTGGDSTMSTVVADAVQVQWASGGGEVENPTAQALRAGAEHNYQFARIGMSVRRLTPRECERLQGFPDDYTLVPHRGQTRLRRSPIQSTRKQHGRKRHALDRRTHRDCRHFMSTTADNTLIEFRNTTALHADLSKWLWKSQYVPGPTPITSEQVLYEMGKRNWHETESIAALLEILRRHSVPVHDLALHEACQLRP